MVTCVVTVALHPAFFGAVRISPFRPLHSLSQQSDLRSLLSANAPRPLLCFHTLTNPFSRSCFPLTLLQTAGGCHPVDHGLLANSSPANKAQSERAFAVSNSGRALDHALLHSLKDQPACFHALTHSFAKTPGVGVSYVLKPRPKGNLAYWIGFILCVE